MDSDTLPGISVSAPWTGESTLKTLDICFRNSLSATAPQAPQPKSIRLSLRPHQRALVHAMREREKASISGISYQGTKTYTNYGILGDEVGSGKSLVVLAYLALLKEQGDHSLTRNLLYPYSQNNLFTVYSKEYTDMSGSTLIVVPHTIYKQWQTYCKEHTTLNMYYVKTIKDLYPLILASPSTEEETTACLNKIRSADAVLISNTLYSAIQELAKTHKLTWRRMMFDEIDSVHIPQTNERPNGAFIWFITATWPNFVMAGHCLRPALLQQYELTPQHYTEDLGKWLTSELGIQTYTTYSTGRTVWLRNRSQPWLRYYQTDHPLRGIPLLICAPDFLKESQSMPQVHYETIQCLQPTSHRVVSSLVTEDVRNMLHAGNIEGALQQLGVPSDTPMGLVEAVTHEREKELDRLRKTLAFKQTMDYATPQAKELALTSLQSKISHLEAQLKTFKERLTSTQVEECPICYDDPKLNNGTITPCCSRIFCGGCILQSLQRGLNCPMCRSTVAMNQLVRIVEQTKPKVSQKDKKSEKEPTLVSKPKQLLQFLKANPQARVLVFSRYENPFAQLERDCEEENISYHTLRGNKDAIASTIRAFERGEKRVLFLPTQTAGAGLNLVSATHVVMLHAMTPEEEKQVVGRAYRLGRTEPLRVVKLLHEGETIQS
jgi:SNF2 family DNA or RNA helicase